MANITTKNWPPPPAQPLWLPSSPPPLLGEYWSNLSLLSFLSKFHYISLALSLFLSFFLFLSSTYSFSPFISAPTYTVFFVFSRPNLTFPPFLSLFGFWLFIFIFATVLLWLVPLTGRAADDSSTRLNSFTKGKRKNKWSRIAGRDVILFSLSVYPGWKTANKKWWAFEWIEIAL